MKPKLILVIVIAIALLIGYGLSTSTKKVVGGELLIDVSGWMIKSKLSDRGWSVEGRTVYGYRAYKVPYVTTDEKNNSVNVSGLMVVPTGLSDAMKKDGLALLSYGHGTIALNKFAPSVATVEFGPIGTAIIFSSLGGFVTLEADYTGYGDSLGHYHPYVMKKSLASSSIDFITAAKKFAKDNNITLSDKLFVTGYSEGGYTAMSTVKKLEEINITVTAAAPMAGPYGLDYMGKSALGFTDESLENYAMTYTALTINAYIKSYDKNISMIMKEPYASKMDKLLDGQSSIKDIDKALPTKTTGENGLLHADFVKDFQTNDTNWFKVALKENSVDDWKPKTPLRFIHCQGDDQVPYSISKNSYKRMVENGAENVTLISPDETEKKKWDHQKCFYPAVRLATSWFAEMRDK